MSENDKTTASLPDIVHDYILEGKDTDMEPLVSIPQTIFINLLLSHSRLGHEEFERNPHYNDQHYQYKASAAINAWLKENEPETFRRFMERMSGPGPINAQHPH